MGNCIKRQRGPHGKSRRHPRRPQRNPLPLTLDETLEEPYVLILQEDPRRHTSTSSGSSFFPSRHLTQTDSSQPGFIYRRVTDSDIDKHVLETLAILRTSAEDDAALLSRMKTFRSWGNSETGWKMVLNSLIRSIPNDEPLGPSAITLFIDHCPLPSKKAVSTFISDLNLSKNDENCGEKSRKRHRNICAVLGHLSENLSAPFSRIILTDEVLEFLTGALQAEKCVTSSASTNALFSLIALEKMAVIRENKEKILSTNIKEWLHDLEKFYVSEDHKKRQVGFLAQWLLDNIFIFEDRPFSYETTDVANINVMLNDKDVSEYLKISPDGLEARSDAPSFESVRCTYSVDRGVWFYEVTVVTSGVMQIGWATKNSKFLNHDGFGIGDDEYSFSYDGCRQLLWYQAQSHSHSHPSWKEGDILGLLLDIDNYEVIFYLNGDPLPPAKSLFYSAKSGFFAAASFMSFQQCRFNFGSKPFKFPPPDKNFSTFNDVAILPESEKMILPKHIKLAKLREVSIVEDSCTICCDALANTIIEPCGHTGICSDCGSQLTQCHLCRVPITELKVN